jgi:2-polyprenyl-3-methyl-5-hydroxy-6-metoxy-1,4-benzoquinol methylase
MKCSLQGPAAKQIAGLFEREESERKASFGRALDLGCGAGIWSVRLAARGWQVTGEDIVPKAIDRARERAKALLGMSGSCVRIRVLRESTSNSDS